MPIFIVKTELIIMKTMKKYHKLISALYDYLLLFILSI